jgi:polysaccharide biosynthesis transport protein
MDANGLQTATIGDYLGWLVRRWWIVAIAVIVGGLGSFGYVHTLPKTYESVTPVLVLAPLGDGTKVDMDTEGNILKSAAVGSGARNLLGTTLTVPQLEAFVSYTVPANTSVLNITFAAATPADAERGSQAFAQAYLDNRNQTAQTALTKQETVLAAQSKTLQDNLAAARAQAASAVKGSDALAKALGEEDLYKTQIAQISARQAPLQGIVVNGGQILSPATTPDSPAKPSIPVYVASGVGVGLLIGLAIALGLARLDTRIYRIKDVPERPDVPVLMEFRPGRHRPAVADAATVLGREFSQLRNILRYAAGAARGGRPSPTDTLLICGAVPGQATGFVAANLAAAFARSGERVVIVCTDLDSTIADILGVRTPYGLGEVLSGEIALEDALQVTPSLQQVSILTSGQLDPRVELPVGQVADLLHQLQQRADRVLIAAAPPSRSVDAQALSEVAAAIVLVVETHRVHAPEIDAALDQFSRVHAPVAGMLVVTDSWKDVKPAKWSAARPAATMARPVKSSFSPPIAPVAVPAAADDEKPAGGRELKGYKGRTTDSTMLLPRQTDLDDPPSADWPSTDSDDTTDFVDSKRSDSR